MVSIIIPTLNEGKYIGKTLSYLAQQSSKPREIIIVDANSEDNTISEIKKFSNLPITILKTRIRQQSHQKNLGALNATSKTLIFLDADIQLRNKDFISHIKANLGNNVGSFTNIKVIPEERKFLDKILIESLNLLLRATYKIKCLGARGCVDYLL